jgi:hypothetical protein
MAALSRGYFEGMSRRARDTRWPVRVPSDDEPTALLVTFEVEDTLVCPPDAPEITRRLLLPPHPAPRPPRGEQPTHVVPRRQRQRRVPLRVWPLFFCALVASFAATASFGLSPIGARTVATLKR